MPIAYAFARRGGDRHLRCVRPSEHEVWVEKTSTGLARRFDVIAVEDLKIRTMTRSAQGSIAEPGSNVAAKAGLCRSFLAAGWGPLVARLQQKAPGRVVKISPAYTGRRCSACGIVDREARESQARFGVPVLRGTPAMPM
ncbi:hypothetical protein [Nonomuraea sp. KM90]|uniref:hypothetical protein n=1 Tax=Nonomuraea sp. KM90 TaxID=3457428 RepID=UPI003FCCB094